MAKRSEAVGARGKREAAIAPASVGGGLRGRAWKRFLSGPDAELLEELYVPALGEVVRYDRCCAYFSSSVLAAAARGFARLIERLQALDERAPRPAVRLVVNEELEEDDVRAMVETGDVSKLEEALLKRFKTPKEVLEKDRLAMLGWLVKRGLLEVRVGVMRRGFGIVHAKFGVATDATGDAVVFNGSGNESAQGLQGNYERLEVSTSWEDPERHSEYVREFQALWTDSHADVHTVSLPEALRLKLVKFAPKQPPVWEPSNALARQKAAMIWRYIVESPYFPDGGVTCDATAMVDLWPHQRRVVEETAEAWPEGRLLCDEVGMGKTIEAVLVLRRLLAGRGVRRALILLPAGLLKQWQAELREKGGLVFPRLEGTNALVWPDDRIERVSGIPEALEQDVLLMSRETARTENNRPLLLQAKPWDLVVLDESHAARRRKQEEGEFNVGTLLLTLLRELQLRRHARSFLLLSATPMQTHPWEPWDLLSVLGEGGAWLSDFAGVRSFYSAAAAVQGGRCDLELAKKAAAVITSDPRFPLVPGGGASPRKPDEVARRLAFVLPGQREEVSRWLRRGSPLARRMHRNTRATLLAYHNLGLLEAPPPHRDVRDRRFDFQDRAEREVYNDVTRYIEKRFAELERERPGKGFVMTIYRRRASSSPQALERSLDRRREGLIRVEEGKAYDPNLMALDELDPRDLDDLDEFEGRISQALPTAPDQARAERLEVETVLENLRALRGRDTKRDVFFEELRRVTDDGRPVLVFTEYTDTVEYLRDQLASHYGPRLGCYTGDGGQVWNGQEWKRVGKDVITRLLREGGLSALVCNDAASEGLNLQTAGAVINYDLPWNPSKIEQRIGRIDRIGQKLPEVRVANLFLKDSVDDRVYRVLRQRCGLFEHFVGAMQPVLARARRMLLGQGDDPHELEDVANVVERDPLASSTYVESEAASAAAGRAAVSRKQIAGALSLLTADLGFKVKTEEAGARWRISGPTLPTTTFVASVEALEADRKAVPLSCSEPKLHALAESLAQHGERLPLAIGSHQSRPFRCTVAYWVGDGHLLPVETLRDLEERVQSWTGEYPEPEEWLRAVAAAKREASQEVERMKARAESKVQEGLQAQIQAARLRLTRELGRYLVCLGEGTSDLNALLAAQIGRGSATADRLRKCLDRLGGCPEWPTELVAEVEAFAAELSEGARNARLLGKPLDAALQDPRWTAA